MKEIETPIAKEIEKKRPYREKGGRVFVIGEFVLTI
jgi:hypothetical protein